jgi:predicted lysophospholipase L1 biosynthesis ABC-type transport system permease subunit
VVVVSQALVRRHLAGREPIGARIRLGAPDGAEPWREIVGVTQDLVNPRVDQPPLAQVYVPMAQAPVRGLVFCLRTRENEATLALVRREVARLDPALAVFEARTVERAVYEDLASDRVITGLFLAFAAVALSLATIGLYGVVSYSVAQRTQEFGVRMALGARAADVLRIVLRQGLALIGAGLVLGLMTGAALARSLAGILYGVSASDPLTFGGVLAALGLAALAATLVPAMRALRVDPIAALRAE